MAEKHDLGKEVDIDLTPMIDVVFQLIIFFVLVTEMAAAELEVLTLPTADQAVSDGVERRRLIVNVNSLGEIKIRGREYTQAGLRRLLAQEARVDWDVEQGLSNRALLIRGDIEAQYKHIQMILQECARVRIWKIELAVTAPSGGRQ